MPNNYQRIAKAIDYLRNHQANQPSLDEVAHQIGLSPFHFQRLFKEFAGVSPKRFLQHLTANHAKRLLRQPTSVLETSLQVGLSGPGRLHDLLINVDAVTPGQYKSAGEQLMIRFGSHESPFGNCLVATTPRGICRLDFVDGNLPELLTALQRNWPKAQLIEDPATTAPLIEKIFSHSRPDGPLELLLRGTNFQLQVWQALLRLPAGQITSYRHLAEQLGQPRSSRAIGNAVGCNPIGYLIPCHRVLRSDGKLGGYRWGGSRKLAILGRELAKAIRE